MAGDQQMCAICLFVVGDDPQPVYTTINGQGVCLDHVAYVQGGSHAVALNLARAHEVGRQQPDGAGD